jgi:ribosomal protein S8
MGRPIFSKLEVVSKPSKRVFVTLSRLSLNHRYYSFCGFFVISTSKGLFTSNDCLLGLNVSGEVILKVVI